MTTEISLGYQMYAVAKLLHQALFLNGTLVNMETWPHFTANKMKLFERAEQHLLRRILSAHSKTPVECLYLELGVKPFRFHLMSRRILYYQTVMSRPDDEITKKVVNCQKETRIEGDFYIQVSDDMEKLNISEDDITTYSNEKLREKLKNETDKAALHHLKELGRNHSKVREWIYSDLNGMGYFFDPRFSTDLSNLLFTFRTRMFNVRNNFRNNYVAHDTICPVCHKCEDSQEHLFDCEPVTLMVDEHGCKYDDIFSDDINKLLKVSKVLKQIVKAREKFEDEQNKQGAEES